MNRHPATLVAVASAVAAVSLAMAATANTGTTIHTKPLADASTQYVDGGSGATCYTAPDAAALTTLSGRTITSLKYHDGKVYYAYGDYNANTGSMNSGQGTNVSYLDAATREFKVALQGMPTEEIAEFREIDGNLYAVNIDPVPPSSTKSMYATNEGGTWKYEGTRWPVNPNTPSKGVPAVHIYDVTKVGETFIMVGARDAGIPVGGVYESSAATVWVSNDGGDTWVEEYIETDAVVANRDGYERFYWTGVIGDRAYVHASSVSGAVLMVRDPQTGTWSPVPGATGFGSGVSLPSKVMSWKNRLWVARTSAIDWYDGNKQGSIPFTGASQQVRGISIGDDDTLVITLGKGEIHRITATETDSGDVLFERDPTYFAFAPHVTFATIGGGHLWTTGVMGPDGRNPSNICAIPLDNAYDLAPKAPAETPEG